MSLSEINTADPIALRYLMTETIFGVEARSISEAGETPKESPEAESTSKLEPTPHFPFYGKNKRKYLFLIEEQRHEWMSEAAMDAFIKTLAALKLAGDDVALLNLAKLVAPPSVDQLTLFFKPRVVVNLGTSFGWSDQDGATLVQTYSFDEMLADAEKKRLFWTKIKTLMV